MDAETTRSGVSFAAERPEPGQLTLALRGRLDADTTAEVWARVIGEADGARAAALTVDASGLTYVDGVGAGLIVELRRRQRERGGEFAIRGLSNETAALLDLFPADRFDRAAAPRRSANLFVEIGKLTWESLVDLRFQIAYIGEMTVELGRALLRPGSIRWRDTFRAMEEVGVHSLPVITIIGFLFGLILAFQSAVPMEKFGAELYVADLVAIATFRELGPLMTAIILAGRSGSAFAAEIGTMKVNEEVDALTTMGLRPMSFLVVPRMIAAMVVTPMLSLFTTLFALVGAGLVIMAYNYPLVTYLTRVTESIGMKEIYLSVSKAFLFGLLIAATGCLRGLQTGKGAMSVGISATRAVVSSIIIVIVADGVIAVVCFVLHI